MKNYQVLIVPVRAQEPTATLKKTVQLRCNANWGSAIVMLSTLISYLKFSAQSNFTDTNLNGLLVTDWMILCLISKIEMGPRKERI